MFKEELYLKIIGLHQNIGTQFFVLFHHVGIIKMWQSLKWIYSNQNAASVYMGTTEFLS